MSDEVPSLLPYAQRKEALAWVKGGSHLESSEPMMRMLRIVARTMHADAVAWVKWVDGVEVGVFGLGIEAYRYAGPESPLAEPPVEFGVHPALVCARRWPEHPLVQRMPTQGSLVVRAIVTADHRKVALAVASRRHSFSSTEQENFAEFTELLAGEAQYVDHRARVVEQRVQATLDVAKLFDDIGEQHWLYRQIVHQMPDRLLFVYDSDQALRLVDGTIRFPGTCADDENLVGKKIAELDCGPDSAQLVAICEKALQGEQATALLESRGRKFDVRTAPIRSRQGVTLFGVGLVHDTTEDAARVAMERVLSARLRALVDSLDSGVLVEDERNVIQHCNVHFCTLMQVAVPPQHLIGRPSPEVIAEVSPAFFIPEALAERIDELKSERKVVKDELVYLADMRILERCYAPLELDGVGVGHLWTYRDVTDRERNKDLLQRQADELRALSLVDELTGLYNRRGFLTLSTQQLKLCDRSMRPAMLVFVDLDGMKRINDELGHEYGDQALVETASVLRQCFRYSDVVARLGGDEFVVLAVEADPPQADQVIERLYEKLAELNALPERKFELNFSVGIAPYDPSKLEMVEEVLARADGLMYEQKRLRKAERKT